MNIQLLSRRELEIINKRTLRYPLAIAEKDYFLAIAMKILANSPISDTLVFKGGTALHHCYLPQSRFSEDLDFTSLNGDLRLETLQEILETQPFFKVVKSYTSPATIKIERLKYEGLLDMPNSLKVEIDIHQNVVLPAKPVAYNNVWGLEFVANTMDILEIAAEKIRAINERARYRDFYDLVLIQRKHQLNISDVANLMLKKEVRQPFSLDSIRRHWTITKEEKIQDHIFYSESVSDSDIEIFLAGLDRDLCAISIL